MKRLMPIERCGRECKHNCMGWVAIDLYRSKNFIYCSHPKSKGHKITGRATFPRWCPLEKAK